MLRLASYNIRKAVGTDRRRRPDRIIEVLNEVGADIVALQEADRRFGAREAAIPPHLLDEHSDLKPVPLSPRAHSLGWHGNAILVRKGMTVRHCAMLHLPSLEPRGAVMVEVEGDGACVRVVGMHLDLSGLWRRRQAHSILMEVEQRRTHMPTVLMGDLNEWTARNGCLRDFGAHLDFADTGRSFHAHNPIARLDRIMVSRDVRIRAAGTHKSPTARTASDHLPVWAEVEVG
ncbi:MAG TPA: endonuclease/exonuclease/phosphatase family protein [Allosphingosinicella sp.]|jgi:endonuclease/exonuclease/phosphatase family metal-dependent hydrolase|nr:endonuclease/exonuclease/phosphatase family protein [Allosphingosinicella sp.]